MEHDLGPIGPEHEIQPGLKPHVANNRNEFQIRKTLFQFQAQVMHRGLGIVEQNQSADTERRQLAAQLRADRPRGTRYENGLSPETGNDLIHRYPDLLTSQQILDPDLPNGCP